MDKKMTPLEAAEKLEKLLFFWKYTCKKDDGVLNYIKAMKLSVSCLRAIAAGEYKRVVHAHWIPKAMPLGMVYVCSNCNYGVDQLTEHCPSCGSPMDGKDDCRA